MGITFVHIEVHPKAPGHCLRWVVTSGNEHEMPHFVMERESLPVLWLLPSPFQETQQCWPGSKQTKRNDHKQNSHSLLLDDIHGCLLTGFEGLYRERTYSRKLRCREQRYFCSLRNVPNRWGTGGRRAPHLTDCGTADTFRGGCQDSQPQALADLILLHCATCVQRLRMTCHSMLGLKSVRKES